MALARLGCRCSTKSAAKRPVSTIVSREAETGLQWAAILAAPRSFGLATRSRTVSPLPARGLIVVTRKPRRR
jgi:hypothetical protein